MSLGSNISLLSLSYKVTRIFNFFTMRQHLGALISGFVQPYHNNYNLELQCRHQHDSVALLSVWLGIYIAPESSRLGRAVASMTRRHCRQHDRHLHRAMSKSPRQHCRQHDSASISYRGQVAPSALSSA
jgi:hypothetical protein